ncbi:MAG: NUDIX hydrolase [Actinobacteria bacterium]|nr:NUDIX hydrolase [Actinomycetota bacterium]
MKGWKITSQKSVFRTPLFDVKEVGLQLPNKNSRNYFIAERRPSVFVLPMTDKFEIFLVNQYRFMFKKVLLELVAGFIEKNEIPIESAKRELGEETGLKADSWRQLTEFEMSSSVFKSKAYIFCAKNLSEGKQNLDEAEDIKVVKLSLDEAVEKVLKGEISNAGSMLGILIADKLRKDKKI